MEETENFVRYVTRGLGQQAHIRTRPKERFSLQQARLQCSEKFTTSDVNLYCAAHSVPSLCEID